MAHQPMPSGVLFSYYQKSEYHEKCVPKQNLPDASKHHTQGDYSKCDFVSQDKVWKQAVEGEKRGVKSWEENWGFLTGFDDKGRAKAHGDLPTEEDPTVFSDELPNTNAGNYGFRTTKTIGQRIQDLEHQFYSDKRRKKMGEELICY